MFEIIKNVGDNMINKNETYVKEHLESLIHQINEENDVVLIETDNKHNAVMMNETFYNAIIETLYLTKDPTNAERLWQSIKALESK